MKEICKEIKIRTIGNVQVCDAMRYDATEYAHRDNLIIAIVIKMHAFYSVIRFLKLHLKQSLANKDTIVKCINLKHLK